jgi:putative IMPACT (imprinted ancient) family translation regulator
LGKRKWIMCNLLCNWSYGRTWESTSILSEEITPSQSASLVQSTQDKKVSNESLTLVAKNTSIANHHCSRVIIPVKNGKQKGKDLFTSNATTAKRLIKGHLHLQLSTICVIITRLSAQNFWRKSVVKIIR